MAISEIFTNEIVDMPKYKLSRREPNFADVPFSEHTHPLDCEEFVWEKCHLKRFKTNDFSVQFSLYDNNYTDQILQQLLRDPDLEWAHQSSFDGIHFAKTFDSANFDWAVDVFAYLEPKHKTFWNIKFNRSKQ